MKKVKRCLAVFLALCMLVGLTPAGAFAETADNAARQVEALEVEGASRIEAPSGGEDAAAAAPYAADELVTVIVELTEAPVMEYFGLSAYSAGAETTPGAAVSAFLGSEDAASLSAELERQQLTMVDRIERLPASAETPAMPADAEIVAQWTNLVNAVAVKVPYGRLAEIRALSGVKNAYVEIVYDRPDEPVTEAGVAGYSYDMVGLSEVWAEGYTGEGMLVAILDTGLDLEWTTYWDNDAGANVTGIRRVHEAFTEDSFKTEAGKTNVRWTEAAMKDFVETTRLNANTGSEGQLIVWDGNALYKNRKVPFAADYADGDLNVRPAASDHGTHVAGTVAGYAQDEEGAVSFSGIAPDAQILAMKVFPDDTDSGAGETAIINALEDAARLGADVVNLSLGSDNGFAEDDTAANEAYGKLREAGILLMTSAGNSAYSSANSSYGSYGLASNPEISMMRAPAVYDSNLSVASINNTVNVQAYFTWTDAAGETHKVVYNDPNGIAMKYKFVGQEAGPIIPVDGVGRYNDYYNAGFRSYYGYGGDKGVTGIALVQRGEISFADKINNASQFYWDYYDSAAGASVRGCPVQAVLVYDNVDGELITMSVDGTTLTSAFISKADGEALIAAVEAGYEVRITVAEEDEVVGWDSAYEMSSFSSWGAGPGLELKPEITAPGGNIWSTILDSSYSGGSGTYTDYTGSYGMMSGTSMAAPHMTGITALVKQYAMSKLGCSAAEAAGLAEQLMVSTAIPQKDGDTWYSPRLQGAGLVSASGAVTAPAYLSVDGQNVGKLELKDNPEKSGAYRLAFDVNNLTDTALTYEARAVLLRPDTAVDENGNVLMLDSDFTIKTVDPGVVAVPANGSASVDRTVSLTEAEKAALNELFANGTYVEGFVILTDAGGDAPQIGLPFLAFYGDWTAAPIFDSAAWLDEVEGGTFLDTEYTWWPTILGYYDGYNYYNLGQNVFDPESGTKQTSYCEENITVSPTGFFTTINDYEIFQLREAKVVMVEVRDKNTGALYYRDYATYQFKTYYDANYGRGIPASLNWFTGTDWDGTDLNGNVLPSGTQCVYSITAYGDGEYPTAYDESAGRVVTDVEAVVPGENEPTFNGHAYNMAGNVISFDVMVDTNAPKLVNNAVTIYEEMAEDGALHTYIEGTFTDEGSIASIQVAPVVSRTYKEGCGDPDYAEESVVTGDSFYTEYIYDKDVGEYRFKADVTNYKHNDSYSGESNYYNFAWTGAVYIYGGDYGGNDRGYAVAVKGNTGEGLILSQSSAKLHVGSEFDLSVIDNTGSGAPITRTSGNPEVASIDEYGHVVALAPGQTVITVSNGTSTAVCIVAVEEYPTEVLDFDLAIDSFSGMKPNGSLIVKVVDLQPADVVLSEIRWVVSEDEETAEYYEGLVNCAQYTSDGLTGEVYLNYSASGDETTVPGGSGTLTVTLNGVSRTMRLDWEDLYRTGTQEDLVSDENGGTQTIYVNQGETATLIAKYNDAAAHDFGSVALYSTEGYVYGGSANPTNPAVGLVLDGPGFYNAGSSWTGRLVNEEGYALPENIHVIFRYDYGYEYELTRDAYYNGYTYDPATGVISLTAPYGTTTTLVIRADGVESEGNPAGELSGVEYQTPEKLYGPFDWAATGGHELTGQLTTEENVAVGYGTKNVAYYTPAEPGVSYITATTKDGRYSVNFAVISEAIKAETLTLDAGDLTLKLGETAALTAALTPAPTLEKHGEVLWTSFAPEVATVDENGVVTAVSAGYAYIKAAAKYDTTVEAYCLVHVLANYTVTFVDHDGAVVEEQTVTEGNKAVVPGALMQRHNGCDFAWLVDEGGSRFDPETTPITADRTLKAVCTVTYTFEAGGETVGTVTKYYGEALTEADYPAVPAREGYTGAWGEPELVDGAMVLKAVYTAVPTDPVTPVDPANPVGPTNPTDPANPADPGTAGSSAAVTSPATGDNAALALWGMLSVTAAAGLAWTRRRRRGE